MSSRKNDSVRDGWSILPTELFYDREKEKGLENYLVFYHLKALHSFAYNFFQFFFWVLAVVFPFLLVVIMIRNDTPIVAFLNSWNDDDDDDTGDVVVASSTTSVTTTSHPTHRTNTLPKHTNNDNEENWGKLTPSSSSMTPVRQSISKMMIEQDCNSSSCSLHPLKQSPSSPSPCFIDIIASSSSSSNGNDNDNDHDKNRPRTLVLVKSILRQGRFGGITSKEEEEGENTSRPLLGIRRRLSLRQSTIYGKRVTFFIEEDDDDDDDASISSVDTEDSLSFCDIMMDKEQDVSTLLLLDDVNDDTAQVLNFVSDDDGSDLNILVGREFHDLGSSSSSSSLWESSYFDKVYEEGEEKDIIILRHSSTTSPSGDDEGNRSMHVHHDDGKHDNDDVHCIVSLSTSQENIDVKQNTKVNDLPSPASRYFRNGTLPLSRTKVLARSSKRQLEDQRKLWRQDSFRSL